MNSDRSPSDIHRLDQATTPGKDGMLKAAGTFVAPINVRFRSQLCSFSATFSISHISFFFPNIFPLSPNKKTYN